jgi:hypothetical protein
MMDQYADDNTDIEENVIVNDLDEEHADEDGSDRGASHLEYCY